MRIEINMMDYVSEEEIKDAILESISSYARGCSEEWYKRVLTNVAYQEVVLVTFKVDEKIDVDLAWYDYEWVVFDNHEAKVIAWMPLPAAYKGGDTE